ncbi:MAG: tRNA (cytidine(34)-2'-O)-methyltransferase [Alphaproteobacteria bacterium]|nr:tRNA (cytidine(34)-2'-O)-methyltransferase [Alphaproteobacteria bacterium]
MRLALFQPDIPQNTGTLLRLGACLDLPLDIIEPCGFIFNEKAMKRAGMDYLNIATYRRHNSWNDFLDYRNQHPDEYGRIVLLTTHASTPYTNFAFKPNDIILMGRESAGVPEAVHKLADSRLLIPMNKNARSINVAVSAVMVIGEALRQTDMFPKSF